MIEEIHEYYRKKIDDIDSETIDNNIDNILKENKAICGIIKSQPKVGEWISCSERLPEEESLLYWTTHEDGSVVLHGYTKRNGFIYNWEVDDLEKRKRQGDVIAWTPIFYPEPYKGE